MKNMSKRYVLAAVAALSVLAAVWSFSFNQEKNMNDFNQTDPGFMALWNSFVEKDVKKHGSLDRDTRYTALLAAHIAIQSRDGYKNVLNEALEQGLSPIKAKEVLYHAVPYAGMAKVYDFFRLTNEVFADRNVRLPLPDQSTTTEADRLEKGLAVQRGIFGAGHIDSMRASAPEELKHIQDFLSANCFGDYYTRGGLDIKKRELVTFVILVSMGGAEPQARAHAKANQNVGNSRVLLLDTVTQILPYIGYPRSLNAIALINEVYSQEK